jgi:hypothetical protein
MVLKDTPLEVKRLRHEAGHSPHPAFRLRMNGNIFPLHT